MTNPGRMEVVARAPLVILDGAHNVAGAEALARGLIEELPVDGETVAIVGMLEGRDPSAMLQALVPAGIGLVLATTAPSPRAMAATTIADAARSVGLEATVAESVVEALALARRRLSADGRLIVTGTLYIVAEARPLLVPSSTQREVSDSLDRVAPSFDE